MAKKLIVKEKLVPRASRSSVGKAKQDEDSSSHSDSPKSLGKAIFYRTRSRITHNNLSTTTLSHSQTGMTTTTSKTLPMTILPSLHSVNPFYSSSISQPIQLLSQKPSYTQSHHTNPQTATFSRPTLSAIGTTTTSTSTCTGTHSTNFNQFNLTKNTFRDTTVKLS